MPGRVEEQIKGKFNPHAAFAIGFVRVMANPGVFLFWIVLAANFISREWVQPTWPGKLSCVAGRGGWNLGLVQRAELRGFARARQIHRKNIVADGTFFRNLHAGRWP